jgi:hypothetical protein
MLETNGLGDFANDFSRAQEDFLNSGPSAVESGECEGTVLEHRMSFYAQAAIQYTLIFLNEGAEEI